MTRVYRISGYTTTGMKFTLEIPAEKPHDAVEKTYSLLGSRHRLKRLQIKIEEVAPVEKIENESVKILQAVDRVLKY